MWFVLHDCLGLLVCFEVLIGFGGCCWIGFAMACLVYGCWLILAFVFSCWLIVLFWTVRFIVIVYLLVVCLHVLLIWYWLDCGCGCCFLLWV